MFDESVFPFDDLRPKAGASLHKEILLLPNNLQNPSQERVNCTDSVVTNQHASVLDDLQEQGQGNMDAESSLEQNSGMYRMLGVPSLLGYKTEATWTLMWIRALKPGLIRRHSSQARRRAHGMRPPPVQHRRVGRRIQVHALPRARPVQLQHVADSVEIRRGCRQSQESRAILLR